MSDHSFLEGFYGAHKAPSTLDAFVARNIKVKDWEPVSDLYNCKWFGYRFLTPGQCLFLFADRYRRAYDGARGRPAYRHIPYKKFSKANVLSLVTKNHVSAMWNAMAFADTLSMPYDFYCKTVIERCERLGYKALPTPAQIYSTEHMWHAKEVWDERLQGGTLIRTASPHYSLTNYDGHAWQDEYMKWLIDQAMERPNPKYALAKIMFEEPQVKPSFAAKHIDLHLIQEAQRVARSPSG